MTEFKSKLENFANNLKLGVETVFRGKTKLSDQVEIHYSDGRKKIMSKDQVQKVAKNGERYGWITANTLAKLEERDKE